MPWVNGAIENANKMLLNRLRCLCTPDHDDSDAPVAVPHTWPDHFDDALAALNDRVLTAIGFTPRELLLGLNLAE